MTNEKLPQRKRIRLEGFDYSSAGCWFITICTANREKLFWLPVGADIIRPPLSPIGQLAEQAVLQIPQHYSMISIDKYCIMPDHIHMIVRICEDFDGRIISAPTLPVMIGSMKRWVSRQAGRPIWQKSYFDHGIRNQQDYLETWQYIDNNPLKYFIQKTDG